MGGGQSLSVMVTFFLVLYGNNGPGAEWTLQASMVQLVALLPPDRRLASSIPDGGTFFSSVHWAHDVLEQLKVNFFRVNDIYLRRTSDKYSCLNGN